MKAAEPMAEEVESGNNPAVRGRHIKKRALKNKALSVSFDEKDLIDFVTGFHKRKKKRRKEAHHQLQEAVRRKRIEQRKKRKEEREYALYGGLQPETDDGASENEEDDEQEEETEPPQSVSGITTYDNGDVKVMVTTSEISREDEYFNENSKAAAPGPATISEKKPSIPVVKKKPFKKVAKKRSHPKPQTKRERKKGKKKSKKRAV